MADTLTVLTELYGTGALGDENVRTAFESLYFRHSALSFVPLVLSEEHRTVVDLIRVRRRLRTHRHLRRMFLMSRTLRSESLVAQLRTPPELSPAQIDRLDREVLAKYDYLVKAVLVARALLQEARRDSFRWAISVLLAVVAAGVTLIAALLS